MLLGFKGFKCRVSSMFGGEALEAFDRGIYNREGI